MANAALVHHRHQTRELLDARAEEAFSAGPMGETGDVPSDINGAGGLFADQITFAG